jgi:hypothetical protein
VIPDLLQRFKHLVDLSQDPKVYPPPDVYRELAREWYGHEPNPVEITSIMHKLKAELDKQSMFDAMHKKFNPSS